MGKGPKTTTTQQQTQNQAYSGTNTYDYLPGPESADISAVRDFQFQNDPRLPYTFARAAQRQKDTYANPLGGATTPQLRDATLRAGAEDIGQQEGQAYREENFGMQGLKYAQKADVAQMTAPRMVQTGQSGTSSGTSSGTGTSQTNPGIMNQLIQGGSAVGSALLM